MTNRMTSAAKLPEWWESLPFPFSRVHTEAGKRPIGFRFNSHIVNISACLHGQEIIVCGEADQAELAMIKAVAELLERAVMIEHWNELGGRSFSSNGWAAHETLESVTESASFELIERDAVLAQWVTSTPFLTLDDSQLPASIEQWRSEELAQSEFPNLSVLVSTEGLGPSVTCILTNDDGFGVSGHSTKLNFVDSIESAVGEACRAAHLFLRRSYWADTLKLKNPASGSTNCEPAAHALYYAYHEAFPAWIWGKTVSLQEVSESWRPQEVLKSAGFTFELMSSEPLFVGKANCRSALSPFWGVPTTEYTESLKRNQRLSLSNGLNLKPHIVA
jgi:hypothetical protein